MGEQSEERDPIGAADFILYGQLLAHLRGLDQVAAYHFCRARGDARKSVVDKLAAHIQAFYKEFADPGGEVDCGPWCWDGQRCVPCDCDPTS